MDFVRDKDVQTSNFKSRNSNHLFAFSLGEIIWHYLFEILISQSLFIP